jgi:DNA gyrase subunit B
VKRGSSEQYLKDGKALENYLIDTGLEGSRLVLASGAERAGGDLREIVEEALSVRAALDALHSRYSRTVIEQAAIAGVLNPEVLSNTENATAAAGYIARRLDAIAEETERGWTGSATQDGGLVFAREVRGVRESWTIDAKLIGSADAIRLDKKAAHLQEIYAKSAKLRRKEGEKTIHGPIDLLEAVFAAGRKGISMQRYKGLGEMNPEQLWETTLDANVRSLLRVKVSELDEADDIFTKLMGDVVEPRRDFIRENALSVANLDV